MVPDRSSCFISFSFIVVCNYLVELKIRYTSFILPQHSCRNNNCANNSRFFQIQIFQKSNHSDVKPELKFSLAIASLQSLYIVKGMMLLLFLLTTITVEPRAEATGKSCDEVEICGIFYFYKNLSKCYPKVCFKIVADSKHCTKEVQ